MGWALRGLGWGGKVVGWIWTVLRMCCAVNAVAWAWFGHEPGWNFYFPGWHRLSCSQLVSVRLDMHWAWDVLCMDLPGHGLCMCNAGHELVSSWPFLGMCLPGN
jgi:hypothetical protein